MRKVGTVIVAAVAIFVLGGIGLFRSIGDRSPVPGTSSQDATDALVAPVVPGGNLAQAIASMQTHLRQVPGDWRGFANLGLAYVQQARITADPSYYPKAAGVLQRSLSLNSQDNDVALVGEASLAAARHDFSDALAWGEKAKLVNPYSPAVYGVIGDAQVELGDYHAAFGSFQTMIDRRPDLSSWARVSYARELIGDVPGAIRAMEVARGYAGSPADAAWADYQLGELYFNSGDLRRAADAYRSGVEASPDFVPPHAGLAKVAWARSDMHRAIDGYTWVVQRYPSPEYVTALGDLYGAQGNQTMASQQYQLVGIERQLFAANGVNVDLELALFEADHGDPASALAAAKAEWERRHSIQVADAYAWALYANGRYREAAVYSRKVLAEGMRNAAFYFHAGMIQMKLGNDADARSLLSTALSINPRFSIMYSSTARTELNRLEGAR